LWQEAYYLFISFLVLKEIIEWAKSKRLK
jgi:hypothetical protein